MSFLGQMSSAGPEPHASARPAMLLVSPEGELLVPGTPAFYDRIGYRNPDFDLGDYAVRNMGFLAIGRLSADRIRLRFRPDLVAGRTIEAVGRYLAEQPTGEIELEYLADEWRRECRPSGPALLYRLAELCAQPMSNRDEQPFVLQPLPLQTAMENYSHPLKPMFQKWRASLGIFNETTLPFLQRFGFFPKLVLVGAAKPGDELRFLFQGSGIQIYDEDTIARLIGEPVVDQPDKSFGAWVNAQYKAFLQAGQPRLDSVEAAVKQSPEQIRTIRYERLMLPWRATTGAAVITVASVLISEHRTNVANENMQPVNPAGARPLSSPGSAG